MSAPCCFLRITASAPQPGNRLTLAGRYRSFYHNVTRGSDGSGFSIISCGRGSGKRSHSYARAWRDLAARRRTRIKSLGSPMMDTQRVRELEGRIAAAIEVVLKPGRAGRRVGPRTTHLMAKADVEVLEAAADKSDQITETSDSSFLHIHRSGNVSSLGSARERSGVPRAPVASRTGHWTWLESGCTMTGRIGIWAQHRSAQERQERPWNRAFAVS
jgi:hypothetical protein